MMPSQSLQSLLSENYESLHDEGCKQRAIDYIKSNESIAHERIFFIKHLTKVAGHILESDPGSLDGLLERIYHFHIEGVMKIKEEDSNGSDAYAQENLTIMRSHLHSHAADFAVAVIKSMNGRSDVHAQKLFWAQERYNNHLMSADLSDRLEPTHAAVHYSDAAKAAWMVFRMLDDQEDALLWNKEEWVKKKYKCDLAAAKKMAEINDPNYLNAYDSAAKALYTLYHLTNNVSYLHECYMLRESLAVMTAKTNPYFSAHQDALAVQTATELSELKGKEFWVKRVLKHRRKVVNYRGDHHPIKGESKFKEAMQISSDNHAKRERCYDRETGYND